MVSKSIKEKTAQARKDGFIVFGLEGGPMPLDKLLTLLQDIFPNHTLGQLAITQAEEDQFVIAARLDRETRPS